MTLTIGKKYRVKSLRRVLKEEAVHSFRHLAEPSVPPTMTQYFGRELTIESATNTHRGTEVYADAESGFYWPERWFETHAIFEENGEEFT